MITRFALILSLCCAVLSVGTGFSQSTQPNVIVILVDDMGWMDLSCQGSDLYRTPAIDRLASEGMRFTDGYAACAVCSPTRAALQTGRYPHRIGVTDWIRSRFQRGNLGTPKQNPTAYVGGANRAFLCPPNPFWMEHEEITIAEALKPRGYQSGYIGKWHLGDPAWFPPGQGYHENFGGCDYGQPPSYFDPYNQPKGRHQTLREGIHNLPGRKKGEYLTHREADEAEGLIRQWHAAKKPFFLMVGHYAVHTPIQAIKEVTAKYEKPGIKKQRAAYAAMVESVDDSTRQILDTLAELKIDKNTLIIFTSDNGGLDRGGTPTENAPLRSGKGYAYEGGIRVPFLVRWPGVIPAGKVSGTPVSSIDIFPTIVEATGPTPPSDRIIDGLSLLPHLKSGGSKKLKRDELLWHFPHYRHAPGPYSIIRKGPHKLIKFYGAPSQLFDLAKDIGEKDDLAATQPQKVNELETLLVKRLIETEAKMPKSNPNWKGKKPSR